MSKMDMDLCQMNIILPAAAAAAEQGAAEELREHIEKMCGVILPIEKEGKSQADHKAIYIGDTRFAADNGVTFPDNAFGEGWAIKAVDGNLVLCGGKVRGALYAVYHLLEDVLGVRWWNIWEEAIPASTAAMVPADYESSGVPAMAFRDVYVAPTKTDSRFFVRNRLNGFKSYAPTKFGGMEDFGEPSHIHTYDRYFPAKYTPTPVHYSAEWGDAMNPEKENYAQTHPEWFAISGRNKQMPRFLCMSNEGLQKAFADKLIKSIAYAYEKADREGVARPRYFDVSPADMFGECACSKCRESIKKHGSSGHQLLFVNKMAEAVEQVYPEVLIDTVAYWHYIEPPKTDVRPRKNVVIRFADNYMDILHDLHHDNNQNFLRRLTAWAGLCAKDRLYVWDYGVIYEPNGIFPSMYKLEKNFQVFKEFGVNGYFLEMENPILCDFWDMKVWLSAKLMENPDLDFRALMDTFIDGYYGAAAQNIRRYLDAVHTLAEKNPGCYRFGSIIIQAEGFGVEDIIAANGEFDAAFAAAEGDEVLMRRLYDARSGLDRVIYENYDRYAAESAAKNLTMPVEKAAVGRRLAENYTRQVALRGEWDETGEPSRKRFERFLPGYVAQEEAFTEQTEHQRLARINGTGNAWKGQSPKIVDESVLSAYKKDGLYIYRTGDFSTLNFDTTEDSDASEGEASLFDIGEAKRTGIYLDDGIMTKWAVENDDPAKIIPVGVYTGEFDAEGVPISNIWGSIQAKDILADGKYHLYQFSDVETVPFKTAGVFHMFRSWDLVIYSLTLELEELLGKKLDCFLSMKVTGDVTCRDPQNLPVYYVDKIIIAEK